MVAVASGAEAAPNKPATPLLGHKAGASPPNSADAREDFTAGAAVEACTAPLDAESALEAKKGNFHSANAGAESAPKSATQRNPRDQARRKGVSVVCFKAKTFRARVVSEIREFCDELSFSISRPLFRDLSG